jgi:hypothetical protein
MSGAWKRVELWAIATGGANDDQGRTEPGAAPDPARMCAFERHAI